MTQPILYPFVINLKTHFAATCNRIEESDALYVASIAPIAAVRDDNMIEGTFFGATTSEADGDHSQFNL